MADHTSIDRPLRVLSLDGGGVRGLSTLLILRRIMYTIKPNSDLKALPRPCDYFDLIGGTSTGGLIAIMLGRLCMDVQSCIEAYCSLSKDIFREETVFGQLGRLLNSTRGKSRFSAQQLEIAVKKIVRERLRDENAPLLSSNSSSAKTFVVATLSGSGTPVCLRSYQSHEEGYGIKIWEACRATTAAPLLFDSISVGSFPPVVFVDGGLGHNNPIKLVEHEARMLWPQSPFALVLSIGTGQPQLRPVGQKLTDVLSTCIRLATESEETAKQFKRDQKNLAELQRYIRFNVEQGLQDVRLEEWRELSNIEAATMSYLDGVREDLNACVEILRDPLKLPRKTGGAIYDVPLRSSPIFTGRVELLQHMNAYFEDRESQASALRVMSLYGLGGVGKTQLALKYAEVSSKRYKFIFWLNATSLATVETSFTHISQILGIQEHSPFSIAATINLFGKLFSADWLMVFDNADFLDDFDLSRYMPSQMNGPQISKRWHIIITSRDPSSRRLATANGAIEVGELSQKDSVNLLLKASTKEGAEAEKIQAAVIVEELGYLPLAIAQAGSYVTMRQIDLSEYLADYRSHLRNHLQFKPSTTLMNYEHTVFTTWNISYNYITERAPEAAQLLDLFSFFDNDGISKDIFKRCCKPQKRWKVGGEIKELPLDQSTVPPWIIHVFSDHGTFDDFKFDSCIQYLRSFSLVQHKEDSGTFYIHPLVNEWARLRMEPLQQSKTFREAIGVLSHATPINDINDALAEASGDLATLNTYYYSARIWLASRPRHDCDSHVSKVARIDMLGTLFSPNDSEERLLNAYGFLLLRSVPHTRSLSAAREFFRYRRRLLSQTGFQFQSEQDYWKALEVASEIRQFAEGSLYYHAIHSAERTGNHVNMFFSSVAPSIGLAYYNRRREASSSNTDDQSQLWMSDLLEGAMNAAVTTASAYRAKEELDNTLRPLRRLRTRVRDFSGLQIQSIKDEDHEAWAEMAEGPFRRNMSWYLGGPAHPDPRVNAAYGEALLALGILRYTYTREEGVRTISLWHPTSLISALSPAEKATFARKKLWLRFANTDNLTL